MPTSNYSVKAENWKGFFSRETYRGPGKGPVKTYKRTWSKVPLAVLDLWFQLQVCIWSWKYPGRLHSGAFPCKPRISKTQLKLLSALFLFVLLWSSFAPSQGRSSPQDTTQTQERPSRFPTGSVCYLFWLPLKPPLFHFSSLWDNSTEVKFIKTRESSFLWRGCCAEDVFLKQDGISLSSEFQLSRNLEMIKWHVGIQASRFHIYQ